MATNGEATPAASGPQEAYDLAILGGGLAGLTLGLQVKQARPQTSIFIAEKREGPAPAAAFKVGESTVELGANYFAEVIGMKDHLEAEHLHKMGLRYFLPAGDNSDLAERVENGPPFVPPVHSFQIDRGIFENELGRRNLAAGNDLFDGCRVEEVDLDDEVHRVTVQRGGQSQAISARWVVDATGRAFTLKRKLGLEEENGHDVNSAWFRLAGGLDYEKWVDDDPEWFARITERGIRHLSTTHLLGQGYWVWLIPLGSGPVSIGIVADPRYHSFERINTLEAAFDWIGEHEPQLGAALEGRRSDVEDFLKIENYSYSCKRQFSGDRWCLVGEAGAFLDPFYSPGSDFVAISNTLATDLVTRDLEGEDVAARADAHQDLFKAHYDGYLKLFEGQYELWGNSTAMNAKVNANFVYYWATITPLFFQRKLADVEFMATVREDCDKVADLNAAVERVCLAWHRLDDREFRRGYISIGFFPDLAYLHLALPQILEEGPLREKIAQNRRLMEGVAVTIFHKAAAALGAQAPDETARVDPYAISLEPERWVEEGLFSDSGLTLAEARAAAPDFEKILVDAVAEPVPG